MVSRWNPYRHVVCGLAHTELGRWLNREFSDIRGLFVYFHAEARNWVVARWVSRQAGTFTDVFVVGPRLSEFSRSNALEVRRRIRQPIEHRRMGERIADAEYGELRRMTDESMTDSEMRRPRKIQVLGG